MQSLASKNGGFLLHLLAVFSASKQNQIAMATSKVPIRILSAMHLSFFAQNKELMQHGWTALGNIVDTPVPSGGKVREEEEREGEREREREGERD